LKIAIGEFIHETNTFSPKRTRLTIGHAGKELLRHFGGSRTPLGGFIDAAQSRGLELTPLESVDEEPSGLICRDDYMQLKNRWLEKLSQSTGVDGVLLSLHGAAVVDGYPDATGDLLCSIRQHVGATIPIVATLDLHANVTRLMVDNASALFAYKTNPHIDGYETGVEAAENTISIMKSKINPTMALNKPGILSPGILRDYSSPMIIFCELARLMKRKRGMIDVSVFLGFHRSDVEEAGFGILSIADGELALAEDTSTMLGTLASSIRREFTVTLAATSEAVKRAVEAREGPVVLADIGDAPGGGGSGDGTVILKALIDMAARGAVLATICDSEAVSEALRMGIGEQARLTIGGKTDKVSGEPIEVIGKVKKITDGFYHCGRINLEMTMGKTVVLDVNGIEVILTEEKVDANDIGLIRSVGIEPTERKIVAVKSNVHYRASYEPIAKEIIEVDSPGLACQDARRLERMFGYKNVRRPIYPLEDS